MSDFNACRTCGRFDLLSSHMCPPRYEVQIVGEGDDWHDTYARDAEEAAERRAERWDRDEYSMMNGTEITARVRAPDGQVTEWIVSGETVPHYRAYQK